MAQDIEGLPDFPDKDDRNPAYRVARATVGALDATFTGGLLSPFLQETIDAAIGIPLEERRVQWLINLAHGFEAIRQRVNGFDPKRLGEDPEFLSVVAAATQIAMRTHHDEKRAALRNAVLNTAVGIRLDDVLRGAFMDYVGSFSVLHLAVLRLLAAPGSSPEIVARVKGMSMGGMETVLHAVLPELKGQSYLLDRVAADLTREGLIQGSLKTTTSSAGLLEKKTTPVGDAFLQFISEPPEAASV